MYSYSLYKFVFVLCFAIILNACHNKQIKPIDQPLQWKQVKSWSFNGKMAINDGENSGSGRIIWAVVNDTTTAQFKAAMGHSWSITESANSAKLESSNNGKTTGNNASSLITNELGWEFPWQSLAYWVRGYQSNQLLSPHSTLVESINDNGWTITYQKWMKTPMGMLPKKIKASKDHYSVKIIIYKWSIN